DGLQLAVAALGTLAAAAGEALARLYGAALVGGILLLDHLEHLADFDRRDVEQVELRIVRGRLPVLAAAVGRPHASRSLAAHAVAAGRVDLDVRVRIVVER